MEFSPYAVLLKTGHGYKEDNKDYLTPVMVDGGSLLVYLDALTINRIKTKYDYNVNYKVADSYHNHYEVFFYVTNHKSSVFCITSLQRDLLLGITHIQHRIEALDRLQWVESLTVGSEVFVTTDDAILTPVKGIIRYIGELLGEEGRKFKVELMVRLLHMFMTAT